jgi:alcohol dehydrogenase
MRAFAFTSYGRDAKGTICDIPEPRIDSDQVLVEMHAASVNPIDLKVRNGDLRFLISRNFPLVLGSDGAVQRFRTFCINPSEYSVRHEVHI